MKFSELVRLLEDHDFHLIRQISISFDRKDPCDIYGKDDWPNLVRVDFHGAKEVPKGTCSAILKAAGVPKP